MTESVFYAGTFIAAIIVLIAITRVLAAQDRRKMNDLLDEKLEAINKAKEKIATFMDDRLEAVERASDGVAQAFEDGVKNLTELRDRERADEQPPTLSHHNLTIPTADEWVPPSEGEMP